MIVAGWVGYRSNGKRWISCRPKLPLACESLLLSRLFPPPDAGDTASPPTDAGPPAVLRRPRPHRAGKGRVSRPISHPLHRTKWFVYSKRPFAGPQQVLAYLSRLHPPRRDLQQPPHRRRRGPAVTFRYKDYRNSRDPAAYKTMTLKPDEFIRRFLMHVPAPTDFHRIRQLRDLLASGTKTETIVRGTSGLFAAGWHLLQTAHQAAASPDSAAATGPGDPTRGPVLRRRMNIIEDLQNRGLDTAIQTAAANRDQDRYVMITFPTSQIQNPVLSSPATRSATAAPRANMPLPRQRRQSIFPGLPQRFSHL